jgi:hypothetical protein
MFSIVMPMDLNRLEQFTVTKRLYDKMPQKKEFLIPTRNRFKLHKYLVEHNLMNNVRLLPYEVEVGFNPSKAFNLGVRASKYQQIIITSPEVMPKTDVLTQLEELIGQNIICQVWDENESHIVEASLVHNGYRDMTPAYYFLAMFNKSDIEKINGWDEDFMKGYAYEDDDFGERWKRAEIPFKVKEEIQAVHQYHPRTETVPGGSMVNYDKLQKNNADGVVRCINGLSKLDIK